jgi:glycosyltransferase involved in cell wall biosynthesis
MNQPLVSIIINNYNYGRYLGQAIDSALVQTYPNTEIIVVDDGSTDDSQEIIKSYGDKIVPVLKANGGHASTFNAGFVVSRGDIICFLDSDDVFLPTKVAEVVQVFHLYQGIDWCFHPLTYIQTDELEKADWQTLINLSSEPAYIEIDFRNEIKTGEQPKFVPQTSAITFSRAILQKILPLPEDQKTYIGDTYLSMAALSLSKGCLYSEPLSFYRLHGSNAYSAPLISKQRETFAKVHIITGYWLRTNYPELAKYTNVFFAKGLSCFWLLEKAEDRYRKFIKDYFSYLSILKKLSLILRASYYSAKSLLFKVLP